MKREEKIELLNQKLVEYFNKHGIDSKFIDLLLSAKASNLDEVFNYVCDKIIESGQAIFMYRLARVAQFMSDEMEDRYISALADTKDAEYICKFLIVWPPLSGQKAYTEKLEKALFETKNMEYILEYIEKGRFTDNFVNLIISTKNANLIYRLASLVRDYSNIEKLRQAIIDTNDIEYIKAFADNVDRLHNDKLNKIVYDYLNKCLPYVEGLDKSKLMNIRNEYEQRPEEDESNKKVVNEDFKDISNIILN